MRCKVNDFFSAVSTFPVVGHFRFPISDFRSPISDLRFPISENEEIYILKFLANFAGGGRRSMCRVSVCAPYPGAREGRWVHESRTKFSTCAKRKP